MLGELYRLCDPFKDDYFCEMLVSKDKSCAYVVGERFRGEANGFDRMLRLNGLDEKKMYTIRELCLTASGKVLMGAGILFPRLLDCESWTWHIEEIETDKNRME